LPVLYVAIGRRLGYPLKLVNTVEHLFVRWEDSDSGERLNIEATSLGFTVRSDEHYHRWPKPAPPQHVRDGWLLQSMTPRQELATFYIARAACFLDWMYFRSAIELVHEASRLWGGEANPYIAPLHALTTILYRGDSGHSRYGHKRSGEAMVEEKGTLRPMQKWERWALKRIEQIHVARRRNKQAHIRNSRIVALADHPYAAADAYFEKELSR
jgi:hypothetical protein